MFAKINWANLLAYVVQPSNMELFQTYLMDMITKPLLGMRTKGLIYGGRISYLSGLTVRVSAGIAVMPDGALIEFPQTDVTLSAADGTNPRIDRLELSFSITNGTAVVNINNQAQVLDKIYTPSIDVAVGTPAASPSAPALTAAKIQLGLVTVPAAAINLNPSNISQIVGSDYVVSEIQLGDKNSFIRFNQSSGQLEFSVDGLVYRAFGSGGGGGGGANWQPVEGLAPSEAIEYGERTFQFEKDAGQAISLFVKVPSSYVSGTPIKLNLSHFSPSSADKFKFQATATLIRKNLDAISSTANQHVSTNGDVTNTLANMLQSVEYDLTDVDGLINMLAVSAGDLLLVQLARVTPTGTEDAADVRVIPSSTEVLFN